MKQKNTFIVDKKDDKTVQILTELGMPKNLAKTLLYISQFDECQRTDIEQCTDLRQPEVSIATQELRRRGWVKKREIKKKTKGRPSHIYMSVTPLSEIWKVLELEKLKEVEAIKNNLLKLKDIIDNKQSQVL